jgi:hypothetical protein
LTKVKLLRILCTLGGEQLAVLVIQQQLLH